MTPLRRRVTEDLILRNPASCPRTAMYSTPEGISEEVVVCHPRWHEALVRNQPPPGVRL